MDLITKAVERAQAERGPGAYQNPVVVPPAGTNEVSGIVYSQTRMISIPKRVLSARRVVTPDAADAQIRPYKILRTRILQRMKENGWNTLAITSPNPGEGKTLTSINLAVSIAMDMSCTVALVDLDLMRPGVHRVMGFSVERGVVDYLQNDTPLQDLLVNPGIPRLVILPGNKPLRNSSEMLSSPKMVHLVNELKARYSSRYVLFDMPPLRGCDDVLAFAPHVDATLLVVEEGKTSVDDLRRATSALSESNIIGTVLNKAVEEGAVYY